MRVFFRPWPSAMAVMLALTAATTAVAAEEGAINATAKGMFDARLFTRAPGNDPIFACFVRTYDGDHLARHPKQKVRAMQLLVTAERDPEAKELNYSFRLGVRYRDRVDLFDSSGFCSHVRPEGSDNELRLGCGVDCDGGGIDIALKNTGRAVLVRLERIRIWHNYKPDEDASDELVAGLDDKIFRLDRTEWKDCAPILADRNELAATRTK